MNDETLKGRRMSNAESMYIMIGEIPGIEMEIIDEIASWPIVEPHNDEWELFTGGLNHATDRETQKRDRP